MRASLEKSGTSSAVHVRYGCPHCGASVWTTLVPLAGARMDGQESWWATVCTASGCQLPALVRVEHVHGTLFHSHGPDAIKMLGVEIIPPAKRRFVGAGVPKGVTVDLTEAIG